MALLNLASTSIEALGRAVIAVQQARRRGEDPRVEDHWLKISPDRNPADLAALLKADLQTRYAMGERPSVAEYLDRYPAIRDERDRVVSLVYEEYCLREERGENPDPESFCGRYEPWKDSLASQLRYHRALSQVAGVTPTAPKLPDPGDRFLYFRLGSLLGQGGAGRVYLAVDEELGDREVALKISPDRGGEPSIQGRLDHAHIVPVLSVAREPETGLRGLCMPYRPGRPLDEVTHRVFKAESRPRKARALWDAARPEGEVEGPESPTWAGFPIGGSYAEGVAWVVVALADALAHAHDRGVCHRDVKPANVLLTRRDGPQLLDFNLAHDPHAAEQAEAALRGGTLPYMAPEQLEAFLDPDCWGAVGPSADIYALGLLLRELLSGKRPEAPGHDLPLPRAVNELLDQRDYPPAPLRELIPGIPRAIDAIALKCLAADPADRYASASNLAEDLRLFLAHKPLRHAPHSFDSETALNWAGRNRRKIVLAAGCLAIAALALLVVRPSLEAIATTKLDMAAKAADEGRYQAALQHVREAEWLSPGNPRAAMIKARASYKKGELAPSRSLYSETIQVAQSRRGGSEDLNRVAVALVDRAAVDVQMGKALQADALRDHDETKYKSSRIHFERAVEDLANARTSPGVGVLEGRLLARIEFQTYYAYAGLAGVAQLVDEYPKAIDYFQRAEFASNAVLKLDGKEKEAQERHNLIDSRLQGARQEMAEFNRRNSNRDRVPK